MRCRIALAACLSFALACGGTSTGPVSPSAGDVDVPGIDSSGFTPREKHELSEYLRALPAPCPTVAVSLAQCVLEKRACAACLPAGKAVAQAVRDGMAREQVEDLYKQRFDASGAKRIPLEGSPARGPDAGPVVIVEFADFECPFCQKLAPELDALWEKHRDRVRFVYKFMPLSMHPHGELAARAAIAAQMQGKFWPMHHQLFANGQRLEQRRSRGLREEHRPRRRQVPRRHAIGRSHPAHRSRSQARRRAWRQRHAHDLHRRSRLRHEGRHRAVGGGRHRRER